MSSTFVWNWYPCGWGSGIDESVRAGYEVWSRPSGSKIRSSKFSATDFPVSCSMMTPSSA